MRAVAQSLSESHVFHLRRARVSNETDAPTDLEALCNPHRIRSRLVDIAEDERSTEPTTGDIKLMLVPKVSQISAVTAHPIKPDAPRTGVTRPVSR